MYNKQKIYEFLNEKGIVYEKMEHDAVYTMEEMDAAGITQKGTVCKNLFLRDVKGKVHYLVTIPEEKKVDLRDLAEQIDSTKLSFGSAERLMKYLGVTQGSVSPLGILNDESESVIMVFDRDLVGDTAVGVHPNDNTATIWLDFKDLKGIIKQHGNEIIFAKFTK
ncbi:MAG: prolyl-tRNA synthetase associated domain-containing protein [Ruminococcaceae bacterium]|nr:prolyl-tRNA synthetase associated domain-containing protein [Oscillospiraceae bacterium]